MGELNIMKPDKKTDFCTPGKRIEILINDASDFCVATMFAIIRPDSSFQVQKNILRKIYKIARQKLEDVYKEKSDEL